MFKKMNFKTKLLAASLAVGIIPFAVVGIASLIEAKAAIETMAYSHLTDVREIKKQEITDYFRTMKAQLHNFKDDPYVINALIEFSEVFDAAGDKAGTPEWKSLSDKYHTRLKDIMQDNGWYDILLIDIDGNIVYTCLREPDLGMDILHSELKDQAIGKGFKSAKLKGKDNFTVVDFSPYSPTGGKPSAFMIASIYDNSGALKGFAAFQIPIDRINSIMQQRDGMGETVEAYLVGSDKLRRSDSFKDPANQSVEASFSNTDKGSVDTEAVREALSGKTGTRIIADYNGNPVLSAYTPVKVGDTTWALLAEIDEAKAVAAVDRFKWLIGIVGVIGIAAIIMVSLLITGGMKKTLDLSVSEVRTASQELKTAAQQQLSSTTEQSTSTTQISTTMKELVTASRQISETSTGVVSAAEGANDSAREGNGSLENLVAGLDEIKEHVEKVVENMLSLGEKTQQMDYAIEIISELSEQTTILSYNATIEAAGAGEGGRRFSALADQIMKLANKATDSTKQVRTMIDDVQKRANKTILVTEDSVKVG